MMFGDYGRDRHDSTFRRPQVINNLTTIASRRIIDMPTFEGPATIEADRSIDLHWSQEGYLSHLKTGFDIHQSAFARISDVGISKRHGQSIAAHASKPAQPSNVPELSTPNAPLPAFNTDRTALGNNRSLHPVNSWICDVHHRVRSRALDLSH